MASEWPLASRYSMAAAGLSATRLLALPLEPLQPWARPDGTVPGRPISTGPLHELVP